MPSNQALNMPLSAIKVKSSKKALEGNFFKIIAFEYTTFKRLK